jgi:hypothetical protein
MNLAEIRFPRELEVDNTAETIRRALLNHTVKLRPDSNFAVPLLEISEPLKIALRKARLNRRIRVGSEAILEKLENEQRGITNVRARSTVAYGNRISRLLLFSSDGAQRFYRHIEQALQTHAPRLLGCLVNIDSMSLGRLITGRDSMIKIIMAEHKEAVSEILRALIAPPAAPSE